jgi:hypothetical protein
MTPATYLPLPPHKPPANDPTLTLDTFIAEVPMDAHRSILVYLRQHGGRVYVRWRVFHRHRKHGKWYPDKRRAFVVPVATADALAGAIASAATGQAVTAKPPWLATLDANRAKMLTKLQDLNAPPVYLERQQRRMARGWGMGPGPMPPLWHRRGKR